MEKPEIKTTQKKIQLKETAEAYFNSLRNKNFATIPFSDDIILRAPLAPGGVQNPLIGKQSVKEKWWMPLEPALEGATITIIDFYYTDSLTGVIAKADIHLPLPGITLRVADLFIIDEQGKITEQENHVDVSALKSYIHHICLRSMDFEKTKHFYQNILGFKLIMDNNDLIIFLAGSVFLAFKKAEPRNKEYSTFSPFEVGLDHIAIACETIEELQQFVKKLNDAAVENTGIKSDTVLNKQYVAFKDPDRISWEFYMV